MCLPNTHLVEIILNMVVSQNRCGILRPNFFPAALRLLCLEMIFTTNGFLEENRVTKGQFCKSVIKLVAKRSVETGPNHNFFVQARYHEH